MRSKLYVLVERNSRYVSLLSIGNSENLGDGFCDIACNNPQCAFDLGDCKDIASTKPSERPSKFNSQIYRNNPHSYHQQLFYLFIESKHSTIRKSASNKERCNEGCPFLWIGDGVSICSFSISPLVL